MDRDVLLGLESSQVFTCHSVEYLPVRYYLKVIAEISVVMCAECCRVCSKIHKTQYNSFQFFNADDFQMAVLQSGTCPVCRTKVQLYSPEREVYDDDDGNL